MTDQIREFINWISVDFPASAIRRRRKDRITLQLDNRSIEIRAWEFDADIYRIGIVSEGRRLEITATADELPELAEAISFLMPVLKISGYLWTPRAERKHYELLARRDAMRPKRFGGSKAIPKPTPKENALNAQETIIKYWFDAAIADETLIIDAVGFLVERGFISRETIRQSFFEAVRRRKE